MQSIEVRAAGAKQASLLNRGELIAFMGARALDFGRLKGREPIAIGIAANIDRFRSYNDHQGFARGDQVIALAKRTIWQTLEEWIPERLRIATGAAVALAISGGDFLTIALHPEDCSHDIARAIFQGLQATQISNEHPEARVNNPLSFSAGYSAGPAPAPDSIARIVEEADRALYRAKSTGGNQLLPFDAE
ncbi:MAG: GGDEF domain-containing protein [bacterium]|nr:GGDEF domain-containing protein [bacterium]